MLVSDSVGAFHRFLSGRGIAASTTGLAELLEAALGFYEGVLADGLAPLPQADMLLYQFGVYDWGKGEHFEIDITRQFIIDGEEDDDAISQLSCTVLYETTSALRLVGNGDHWCESRGGLPAFRDFILSGVAYVTALPLPHQQIEIDWSPV